MRHRFRDSVLDLYYTFYHDDNCVDVNYRVHWREKHYVLKLELPVEHSHHTASVPYGGKPQQAQLLCMGRSYAFTLAPYEIKTLLLTEGEIREINPIEDL